MPFSILKNFHDGIYNFDYPTDFSIINEKIFSMLVRDQETNNTKKNSQNLILPIILSIKIK